MKELYSAIQYILSIFAQFDKGDWVTLLSLVTAIISTIFAIYYSPFGKRQYEVAVRTLDLTRKSEYEDWKVKELKIRPIDVSCYVERDLVAHSDVIDFPKDLYFKTVFDVKKFRLIDVPLGEELYIRAIISLFNFDIEPVYIRGVFVSTLRSLTNGTLPIRDYLGYPSDKVRIKDRQTNKDITFDEWMEIKIEQKLIWIVYINVSSERKHYAHTHITQSVIMNFATDKKNHIMTIDVANEKSFGKWMAIDKSSSRKMVDVFDL